MTTASTDSEFPDSELWTLEYDEERQRSSLYEPGSSSEENWRACITIIGPRERGEEFLRKLRELDALGGDFWITVHPRFLLRQGGEAREIAKLLKEQAKTIEFACEEIENAVYQDVDDARTLQPRKA